MELTKRAVLYVGYLCNANCKFCYYHHMKNKKWKKISRAKLEAWIYRKIFGNTRVDITGGEPTIYPHILELVKFCSKIGLRPTIITNGLALADEKKVLDLKNAGVFDYLISIHGLGENYNKIVGLPNGAKLQEKAIKNLQKNKIPIRVNFTLTKLNSPQLLDVARYCIKIKARVVNFISFNPFNEWEGFGKIDFQERHSVLAKNLAKAIKLLEANGIESNVRYFPFCCLKGFEKNQYNFPQVPYDSHEWDFMPWFKSWKFAPQFFLRKHLFKEDRKFLLKYYSKQIPFITKKLHYKRSFECSKCSLCKICDGPTEQYIGSFGENEFKHYPGKNINDPEFFIRGQFKIKD